MYTDPSIVYVCICMSSNKPLQRCWLESVSGDERQDDKTTRRQNDTQRKTNVFIDRVTGITTRCIKEENEKKKYVITLLETHARTNTCVRETFIVSFTCRDV